MNKQHHENSTIGRNEKLVLDCLQNADGPMGAYDILDRVKSHGIKAPLQVYRALDKLRALGHAHRLESLNAFVACAGDECHRTGTTAFAICSSCGNVQEFADLIVQQRLVGWAEQSGFIANSSMVELRGRCATCTHSH